MAVTGGVEIVNMPAFRRDLRRAFGSVPKDLAAGIREAGSRLIVPRAAQVAAKRTGALAGSYYVKATTTQGSILSRVAYGAGAEWGLHGKWSGFRRYPAFGTGASAGRGRFAWRAVVERREELLMFVFQKLEDVIRIYGWAS